MIQRKVIPYRTNFNRPFTTSHGTRTGTDVILLELTWEGVTGYGEASIPPYRDTDAEKLIDLLEVAPLTDPTQGIDLLLDRLAIFFAERNEGLAAFDIALHDLFAKRAGLTVSQLLNIPSGKGGRNMYTIATNKTSEIRERVQEAPKTDILKFKLTGEHDEAMLLEMSQYLDRPLFIDANQGWDGVDHWKKLEPILATCDLIGIEQPFSTADDDMAAQLKALTPVPVYADESFESMSDLPKIQQAFSGINIKLMKCGGIRNALKIIQSAREAGLKTMLGTMSESSCGTAAALQMASLVDLLDQDGPWLIANDPFKSVGGTGLGISKAY